VPASPAQYLTRVDDVEVEGEDVLAHRGGFGFRLVGQRIEVQIRLPEEGEDLHQRVTKFSREKIARVGVEVGVAWMHGGFGEKVCVEAVAVMQL